MVSRHFLPTNDRATVDDSCYKNRNNINNNNNNSNNEKKKGETVNSVGCNEAAVAVRERQAVN